MAILGKRHPLNGVRGRIGKIFVFKKYGMKTVMSNFPAESKNDRKPTKAQQTQRAKFQDAVAYARQALKDPKQKAAYARRLKGHRNVFQAELADYMKKGDVLRDKLD